MPSPLSEQPLSSAKEIMSTAADNTQAFLVHEQLSLLQVHLAQQQEGPMLDSPSYVCEWMSTNVLLPADNTKAGKEAYLCLPTHLSEASYFKHNEEKEEFKDDGYCNATASRLRMMQLDRYLATVAPLASSARKLLFDGRPAVRDSGSNRQVHPESLKIVTQGRLGNRRSKFERHYQLPRVHCISPPHHRLITSTNSGRVINVMQGEIAHCTPSQAETLVSDDATTCHIVALWSRTSGLEGRGVNVLGTMTHIDGPGYEASIRDAVDEHVKYHSTHSKQVLTISSEECKENLLYQENAGREIIEMSIHIMGGFNDYEGSSIEITDDVLHTFAALSNEYSINSVTRGLPRIRMTLETCAVVSANDDGFSCPLGRGLAMEVATGNVFVAKVEDVSTHHRSLPMEPSAVVASNNEVGIVAVDGDIQLFQTAANSKYISAMGPEVTLRSVRLWASAFHSRDRKQERKLNIIHRPNRVHLCIEPFFFGPHSSAKSLLYCSDKELLSLTSTSPEVENPNFVAKVRESLTYMNETNSLKVFSFDLPMEFQRVGLNGWVHNSQGWNL